MSEHTINTLIIWGTPILTVLGGIVLGLLFKRYILNRLRRLVAKTKWQGDDIVVEGLGSFIVFWFFLAALFIVVTRSQVAEPYDHYLNKLVEIALIMSITLATSKIVVGLMTLRAQKSALPSTAIFTNLFRITIILIGLMVVLDSMDVSITPMLTALGVGGLAVSLALKDTLSDFFSGLHILLSQKVVPGDYVELDSGETGEIVNITWRNTSMRERSNNIISIPNARLSNATIRNFNTNDPRFLVKVPVGIAYSSDLDKVRDVTLEVARETVAAVDGADKTYQLRFRYYEFGESSINFYLFFQVMEFGAQFEVTDEFISRLQKRYAKEGIEIPFPMRTVIQRAN